MPATLNQRIANFYDQSTKIWLDTWGEHMHHGYYPMNETAPASHQEAQIRLVTEMLQWGKVESADRILDAGCGVGGSARLLAKLFDANVLGCTLSPVQASYGNAYSKKAGLSEQVMIKAKDMMSLKPEDGPFDLIWSMESAEHIKDKPALLELFYSLLKPGGTLLLATWYHRPEPPSIQTNEQKLLDRIYDYYHLPPMISIPVLQDMAMEAGFTQVQSEDWSEQVAPFWKAVIRSALTLNSIQGLLKAGWPTIKGAWAMRYMTKGYKMGLIQFGVLQGKKL
jgi:tocopherol O-methyltransferase